MKDKRLDISIQIERAADVTVYLLEGDDNVDE